MCEEGRDSTAYVTVHELFDTVGLTAEIDSAVTVPIRPDHDHAIDFISRYGTDGMATASGVWASSLDDSVTLAVATVLAARVRPLGRLLEPAGFHSRLTFRPKPAIALDNPIVCVPHLRHEEGLRPVGLPPGVQIVGSVGRDEGDSAIIIYVLLDERGEVTGVTSARGSDVALATARDIITQLVFDPALWNGEGVPGRARLGLRFSPSN